MSAEPEGSEGASADPSAGPLDELERRVAELEQRGDAMFESKVDAAVEARIRRIVLQNGPGILVTGGNGNWTIELDASALSMSGRGICNADGSSTFTFSLKL